MDDEDVDWDYYYDLYKEQLYEELENLYKQIDKLFDDLKKKQFGINASFYHYTSVETLKLITSSGKLRFTDIRFLNDPSEGDEISQMIPEICDELSDTDSTNAAIYSVIKSVFETDNYTKDDPYLKKIIEKVNGNNHYISCFSKCSDYLPLWTYYSLKDGCNIEYSQEDFSDTKYPVRIEPVIYTESEKKNILQKIIKMISETRYVKDDDHRVSNVVLYIVDRLKPVFKNEDFKFEEEVRAVIKNVDDNDVDYFVRDGYVTPYYEMVLKKNRYLVTTGPLYRHELDSLNNYLKKYNGTATKSRIRLRF